MRNKKEKVLIVDDMETNRITLETILSGDYEILQAENGAAAIDILYNASELPSIVLLDIMMPEMDGFEVLNLIKSNTHTAGIPVVFITAADIKSTELESARLVLEAHENLVAVEDSNRAKFQDVLAFLKNRIEQG